MLFLPLLLPCGLVSSDEARPPAYSGDPDAEGLLDSWITGAMRSTEAYGPWPQAPWTLNLHESDEEFDQATGAPPGRSALWIDSVLHLRSWQTLQRRDLGAILRHEFVHRRLTEQGLPRWKEEAICLWAESHAHPPAKWPEDPEPELQLRLNNALESGTTAFQRWAYAWLRAWIAHRPPPAATHPAIPNPDPWKSDTKPVSVVWPPERLPRTVAVNKNYLSWRHGARFTFTGEARFGAGMPVSRLEGIILLEGVQKGWRLTWTTNFQTWEAAAVDGELGAEAPFEAKRALASVLQIWLEAHPNGNHPDGSFCPLTHCAVIRGQPDPATVQAVAQAPTLDISPNRACFTGSKGGVSLSPREVWGQGSPVEGRGLEIPGDLWATWTRRLTAAQVRALKTALKPGLKPGQKGLRLGQSGPYPVESLRLETGRRFGWTAWPSNACTAVLQSDGSLLIHGHGWGHNVGLCLATAKFRARNGERAEAILQEAFDLEPR